MTQMMNFLSKVLITGVAYYVSGRLGLLLAIPPGYATAVWPASGIALVATLLFGYRVLPGVLLGSFCINAGVTLDTTRTTAILNSLSLAFGVGIGAAIQAAVGAHLIRRFVGFPTPLDLRGDVVRFLGLAGPISCLVNATLGVTTLWMGGAVQREEYLANWFTWWVGDTFGVVIFTPLLFIWLAEPREVWRRRRMSLALPLSLSFGAAVVFYVYASVREQTRVQLGFEQQAAVLAEALESNLEVGLEVLYGLESFYHSSVRFDRQAFQEYAASSLGRYPEIQALSWSEYVLEARRARYEEIGRLDGLPTFQITELDSLNELVKAARHADYVPVTYLVPQSGNARALGFNVASDSARSKALSRSRDTGKPSVTGRIAAVQETGDSCGFLVYLPVYSNEYIANSAELRRLHLRGYLTGFFSVGDFVQHAWAGLDASDVHLRIYDAMASAAEDLIFLHGLTTEESSDPHLEEQRKSSLQWSTHIGERVGHPWRLEFNPGRNHSNRRSWQLWSVLTGGFLFTSVLGTFLLVITGDINRMQAVDAALRKAHEELEQRVDSRTHELKNANEQLQNEIVGRKAMEQELVRTQRLRAVGELAAGVSHNLNNILTGVLAPAQMLVRASEDVQVQELAEWILSSARRASGLVERLGRSMRHSPEERQEGVDVNGLVERSLEETRVRWKDESEARGVRIDVIKELEWVPPISGTRSGLADVLTNLVFNAVDAMPGGGTLTVRTEQGSAGVRLSVSDTGVGMDEDTRRRAFEPLFTTKMEVGHGLGLATVYGTVTGWAGEVDVTSVPGKGTTFSVHLPVWTSLEPADEVSGEQASVPKRRPRILVVEDEEIIRLIVLKHLSEDCEVTMAEGGKEALEMFSAGRYDIALIDIGMPKIPGDQVAMEFRKADPALVTVLMTGWVLAEDDPRRPFFDFQLSKPVEIEELDAIVTRALALHDGRVSGESST